MQQPISYTGFDIFLRHDCTLSCLLWATWWVQAAQASSSRGRSHLQARASILEKSSALRPLYSFQRWKTLSRLLCCQCSRLSRQALCSITLYLHWNMVTFCDPSQCGGRCVAMQCYHVADLAAEHLAA